LSPRRWPERSCANGDPLGELLEDSRRRTLQIIGIARNTDAGFGAGGTSIVYTPRADDGGGAMLVRFSGDAAAAAHAVREVIQALDHDAAVEPRTLAAVRDELADRFLRVVGMVGFLGIVAIGLAAIGIYSVAAFAASRRIREMGIRIALGATRTDILALVLWAGARPIVAGLLVGLTLAIVASVGLQQVFAQAPIAIDLRDPATYVAAIAILAALALAAMLGPARRAASADPMYALRQD
jgi:ABC-type antimicrobial peptide transport system permease subunit